MHSQALNRLTDVNSHSKFPSTHAHTAHHKHIAPVMFLTVAVLALVASASATTASPHSSLEIIAEDVAPIASRVKPADDISFVGRSLLTTGYQLCCYVSNIGDAECKCEAVCPFSPDLIGAEPVPCDTFADESTSLLVESCKEFVSEIISERTCPTAKFSLKVKSNSKKTYSIDLDSQLEDLMTAMCDVVKKSFEKKVEDATGYKISDEFNKKIRDPGCEAVTAPIGNGALGYQDAIAFVMLVVCFQLLI